jgi:6-pyruvoyl-tetrahydropterin synthase
LEDDYFLQVSSARRLKNISGMVRDREEVKVSKCALTNQFEWKGLQQCHHPNFYIP